MLEIPPRHGLTALTEAVRVIAPVGSVGFTRSLESESFSVQYSSPHGIGEFILPASELPEAMRPSANGTRRADAAALRARPEGALEWLFSIGDVQQVLSVRLPSIEPATHFWAGFLPPDPLSAEQLDQLSAIALQSATALISARVPPEAITTRLHRLEKTARLLPALLRVLDVREVFDRVSAIAKDALPHDLLLLRLFNDDLTEITTYAGTGPGEYVGATLPRHNPVSSVLRREFDIIDDHRLHRAEHDKPPAKMGARASIRLPVRFDGRVIGGIGFMSFEPGAYGSEDVPIARRLADHVAAALSHHRLALQLADQARDNQELRARTTSIELLDELLSALIDSGDLPDVFDRICTIAQKVIAHDAAVLMVRLADGVHARLYASSGLPPVPEVTEVPEELLATPDWDHDIFDDLAALNHARYARLVQLGFRSLLRVPIRLEGRFAGALIFMSRALAGFRPTDILVARRMADRMAATLARDRELAASRRADEATERASQLETRVRALTDELDSRTGYRRVIGESVQWRQVLTQATQVSATDATVLLLGESGTGKEVIARFLHRASARKSGPFVALNCAALPEQLLEAELFGYERGAYTGATQSKPGQLEQAAGGTLFLDEVGEMSLPAQAKFLRVLQEREFQRLGGTRVLRSDARVVAATNRDLPRAIANGQFREDLYYRLNVFAIRLPSLRDRRDDILPLSDAFLTEIGRGLGRPPGGISREARRQLVEYHWPGNVRELRNMLERAAILCDGGLITPEYLALTIAPPMAAPEPAPVAFVATMPPAVPLADLAAAGASHAAGVLPSSAGDLQSMERAMIEQALQTARFNKSKAAKALGLTRHQLYIRMRKYGFDA
jgi:transcriptional regulator with GAF, ATPase, and Fis domain